MTESKSIDELLAEVRSRAENYGKIYGRKETADDYVKVTYAKLYEDIPQKYDGSVDERASWIRRQPDYVAAVERKRDAYADWKAAETYMKVLLAEVEVWRSRAATARAQDKLHL